MASKVALKGRYSDGHTAWTDTFECRAKGRFLRQRVLEIDRMDPWHT